MWFTLLGPICAGTAPSRLVTVTARRQRILLATLALHAASTVDTARLIDAIWAERPPRSASNQVQGIVSALRKLLATAGLTGEVIVSEPGGYRLRADPHCVDLWEFRRLRDEARLAAADGRTERAQDAYRAALALWRGPALAGADSPALRQAASVLADEHLQTLEERIETDLALGATRELIPELADLVDQHPYRERLHSAHLLALYRAGRRADALAAYQRTRGILRDELGVEPGPELQHLHRAIRNGEPDPTLRKDPAAPPATASPVPRQLPADVTGFVGRTEALRRLDGLLRTPAAGSAAPVAIATISGTGGVGKTALAVHWAHRAADRFPDGQLYANLQGYGPTRAPTPPGEALRGFLGGLAVPPDRIPASLAAQIDLYRSLLADRRVLVVLDNAADAGQVRPLLPSGSGCLAIVTSRNLLSGLVVSEGAVPLALDVLDPTDARQLLERRLGADRVAAEPDQVADLVHRCGRLPLALAVVAARAAVHPDFSLRALADGLRDAAGTLDGLADPDATTDVRTVLSWSYHALTADAARLFRLLGLHPGPDLSAAAAASLADLPPARAGRLLAELAQASLLTEPSPGRYGLHDLLRAYATERVETQETPAGQRAALRRMFDYYLHTAEPAAALVDPQRYRPGSPRPPAPARPAPTSEPPAATEDGHAWLSSERAVLAAIVAQAGATGFDRHASGLALALSTFLDRLGHWADLLHTQHLGLAAAQRLSDPAAQAHFRRYLGLAFARQHRWEDATYHLKHALDLLADLGDLRGQAAAHLALGAIGEYQDRADQTLHHSRRALALASAAGHRLGQARALGGIGWGYVLLGDYPAAIDHGERALSVHEEIDDPAGAANVWDTLGSARHGLGDQQRAIACYRRALQLYDRVEVRKGRAETLHRLGDAYLAAGDRPGARDSWQAALDIFDELGDPAAEQVRAKLTGPVPPPPPASRTGHAGGGSGGSSPAGSGRSSG